MAETEVVDVPAKMAGLAERRTRAIIRAAVLFPDALNVIAKSCYLQGLEDAADVLFRSEAAEQAKEPTR